MSVQPNKSLAARYIRQLRLPIYALTFQHSSRLGRLSWRVQSQVRLTLETQLLKTTAQHENDLLMAEFMRLL
ncbi:MAG: hypothetical protein ACYC0V_14850 [Armatimonadota bacterium]